MLVVWTSCVYYFVPVSIIGGDILIYIRFDRKLLIMCVLLGDFFF